MQTFFARVSLEASLLKFTAAVAFLERRRNWVSRGGTPSVAHHPPVPSCEVFTLANTIRKAHSLRVCLWCHVCVRDPCASVPPRWDAVVKQLCVQPRDKAKQAKWNAHHQNKHKSLWCFPLSPCNGVSRPASCVCWVLCVCQWGGRDFRILVVTSASVICGTRPRT